MAHRNSYDSSSDLSQIDLCMITVYTIIWGYFLSPAHIIWKFLMIRTSVFLLHLPL